MAARRSKHQTFTNRYEGSRLVYGLDYVKRMSEEWGHENEEGKLATMVELYDELLDLVDALHACIGSKEWKDLEPHEQDLAVLLHRKLHHPEDWVTPA